ncbi:hypothetical protein A2851_00110 [Candidatus Kaiserbacteria bacterium RIFCSPHIGHO2_01_FULL_53_29]|uniref:SpoVT-AbrB domain-containing protein n=1 Tax=Candidatus Kaiserbacteria bacterium RIFCSPHIGHO2_01_FULL_53_29 TaxID=1798480 RepID=A0A1F6CW27_9BACT|nr:MAG: hypothetical protein A2851_00110 [Candidatus Kaiserbacteria bacterium RIFCSPHIGHO2_01_FULL_53_29]
MNISVKTRAAKWGNSIGVRLSARVAARAGITEHTEITVEAKENSIVLSPIKTKNIRATRRSLKTLLKNVRPRLTAEDKEWLDMKPVGREAL